MCAVLTVYKHKKWTYVNNSKIEYKNFIVSKTKNLSLIDLAIGAAGQVLLVQETFPGHKFCLQSWRHLGHG